MNDKSGKVKSFVRTFVGRKKSEIFRHFYEASQDDRKKMTELDLVR